MENEYNFPCLPTRNHMEVLHCLIHWLWKGTYIYSQVHSSVQPYQLSSLQEQHYVQFLNNEVWVKNMFFLN